MTLKVMVSGKGGIRIQEYVGDADVDGASHELSGLLAVEQFFEDYQEDWAPIANVCGPFTLQHDRMESWEHCGKCGGSWPITTTLTNYVPTVGLGSDCKRAFSQLKRAGRL